MAFSFGSTTAAPAPAPGAAFSFATPAAAPTGGGLFGAPAPAPATTAAGGGGFSFGATPAPAPSTTGFGGGTSLFGAAPAPATGGSLFGGASTPVGQPPAQPLQHRPAAIAGYMSYAELPNDWKLVIDRIHETMMSHKRTMAMVTTMAPHALQSGELPQRTARLDRELSGLRQTMGQLGAALSALQEDAETALAQATMHAQWPTEALRERAGLRRAASPPEEKKDEAAAPASALSTLPEPEQQALQERLRAALDRQMATVDRLDRMPSPFLVATLKGLQKRLEELSFQAQQLQQRYDFLSQLAATKRGGLEQQNDQGHFRAMAAMVEYQMAILTRVAYTLQQLHTELHERIVPQYASSERGRNVLDQARAEDWQRQRHMEEQAQHQYLKAAAAKDATSGTAPAPAGGGLFGGAVPGAGGGLFGSTSSTPATSSLFGAPAPAPGLGTAFGSTPTPGAPAPAFTGFSFAGSGAPVPSFPASYSSSSTSNKKKSTSRSRDRLSR